MSATAPTHLALHKNASLETWRTACGLRLANAEHWVSNTSGRKPTCKRCLAAAVSGGAAEQEPGE